MKKKYIATVLLASLIVMTAFSACGGTNTSVSDETASLTEKINENEEDADSELEETDKEAENKDTEKEEVTEGETVEKGDKEPEVNEEVEEINYSYTDMSETMYATTTVNIRNKPSKTGDRVGILCENNEILVTGQCNETKWYRLDFNGNVGYVSYDFLTSEKPEEEELPAEEAVNGVSENDAVSLDESSDEPPVETSDAPNDENAEPSDNTEI
ncbi:MAG: SH3 domain-containing protein [Acetatifactor sp.]|nr:SH3 domain-containing protein [Acetatifactor sp.]